MIIYKATNNLTGEIYIGQTSYSLANRKEGHRKSVDYGSTTHFHNALRKYGIDNFRWQVICICPDIDSLNERERFYIALYNSMNNGYNRTSGGVHYEISDKRKEEIRQRQLKYWSKIRGETQWKNQCTSSN